MTSWTLGIIGGSGLYALDGLEDARWQCVDTPFGAPSDQLLTGRLAGVPIVFLPRHGRGHNVPPDQLNARANIMALKQLGVTDIVSVSAVGSLHGSFAPGDFVLVDQFIDRTHGRPSSFFGSGLVAHIGFSDPICPRLTGLLARAARSVGGHVHEGGTYLAMQGPQFSTRAESRLYRQWGAHVIGMTAMPEARLAREAQLPYALLAMVTDYDSWKDDAAPVSVPEILSLITANAATARQTIAALAALLPATRTPSPIDRALQGAIVTAPDQRDAALVAALGLLLRA